MPRVDRVDKIIFTILFLLMALGLWAFFGEGAKAETGTLYSGVTSMTFQNGVGPTAGYTGCSDTYISAGLANSNFGACDTLKVSSPGWTGNQVGRHITLISFDISALPDSAIITQAYLHLYQYSNNAGANQDSIFVRRLYNAWTEGSGACTGTAESSADWDSATASAAWALAGASSFSVRQYTSSDSALSPTILSSDTTFGGDIASDAALDPIAVTLAKSGVGAGNRYGWIAFDITAQVMRWHIGQNENDGIAIYPHNNAYDKLMAFYSSEYAGKAYRPKLIIQYFDPTTSSGGAVRRTVGGSSGVE